MGDREISVDEPTAPTAGGPLTVGAQPQPDPTQVFAAMHRLRARVLGTAPAPFRVGRYVLLAPLGSGGMSVVYDAWDPQLKRQVAVKLLRPSRSGAGKEERLREECRALARLEHPNVVRVFDVGSYDPADLQGLIESSPRRRRGLYMVMERLEGRTLTEWIRDEPSVERILEIFAAAGSGLMAAHAVGIVHRDFKLSNVIITTQGEVKVLDFGIAMVLESPSSISTDERRDARGRLEAAGTPGYMAPEQWEAGYIDARTDQFGFCASLYRALYGVPAFEGSDLDTLQDAAYAGQLRAPLRVDVPRHVVRAIRRGLSPGPQERFPTMEALLAALQRRGSRRRWMLVPPAVALLYGLASWGAGTDELGCEELAHEALEVWNESSRAHLRASLERPADPAAMDSVRALIEGIDRYSQSWWEGYGAVCGATSPDLEDAEARRRLVCLAGRARTLRTLIETLGDGGETIVPDPSTLERLPRVRVCAQEGADQEHPAFEEQVRLVPGLIEDWHRANGLFAAGRDAEAEVAFARVQGQAAAEGLSVVEGQVSLARAEALLALSRLDAAQEEFEATLWRSEGATTMVQRAIAYAELSDIARQRGDLELARSHLQNAQRAASTVEHPRRAATWLLTAEAALALDEGRTDDAERAFEEALQIAEDPTARATALSNLGSVLFMRGEYARVRPLYEEARDLTVAAFGSAHPRTGQILGNVGNVYLKVGEFEHAKASAARAVEIARLQGDPRSIASTINNYAGLLIELGEYESARALLVEALEGGDATGRNPFVEGALRINLAQANMRLGNSERVNDELSLAVELLAPLGAEHPLQAHAKLARAEAELTRRNVAAAEILALEAMHTFESSLADPVTLGDAARILERAVALEGRAPWQRVAWAVAAEAHYANGGPLGERRLRQRRSQ